MVHEDPRLKSVYSRYDADGNGLDTKELQSALKELDLDASPKDLEAIMGEVDRDKSGLLSMDEFAMIFSDVKLRSVFTEMDEDSSGNISTWELSKALRKLGYNLPPNEIKSILRKVDKDESGEVSFDEFAQFFKYVPAASLESIAKRWVDSVSMDCGSDLSPPVQSPLVPWYYGLLGGLGGVTSRTLTAPLEKVKLVAQTSANPVSITKELANTYKELGFRGLFSGNLANCLRVFPYTGIVTLVYLNGLKFTPADNELDPMEPVYRGSVAATAGVIGQLATYPIDVVRAQISVNPTKYSGLTDCFRSIIKESGTGGLYKGLVPTLSAVAPFLACQMATADALKSVCADYDVEVTPARMILIGGTAGCVAQSFVYPLDVLRRRMQVQGASNAGNLNVISDSTWVAVRQVVQKEGVRSLFAGMGPTLMKVFPACAIGMTCTKELIGYSKNNWE